MVAQIRSVETGDAIHLQKWLENPEVSRDFPVADPQEVEESAKRWVEMALPEAGLIAIYRGEPVGFAMLFLHNYKRLKHQAYHILLVDQPYRRLGIGSELLEALIALARERHGLELIHTEVYGASETLQFYKRRGFEECARQEEWVWDGDEKLPRILVEKFV